MPFAGFVVKEIAELQLPEFVAKEIDELKLELVKNEKQKIKKNMDEITADYRYDDCLMCKHQQLGDNDTRFPPYGRFRWNEMLLNISYYMHHLYVYRYTDAEMNIFVKSLDECDFFEYKGVKTVKWAFKFHLATGILRVIKCPSAY